MVVDVGIVKNHIKPKADSTLRNMRKDDLIEYIRCLENNYNVAVSFNENQAKYIESLDVPSVVHGYNTGKARLFQCSVCGYGFDDIYLIDESPNMIEPRYCAHCGAQMDGGMKYSE